MQNRNSCTFLPMPISAHSGSYPRKIIQNSPQLILNRKYPKIKFKDGGLKLGIFVLGTNTKLFIRQNFNSSLRRI